MKLYFLLIFFFIPILTFAQTDTTYVEPEESLEDLLDIPVEDEESENFIDLIEDLLINKIDINTSDINTLLQIPLLDFKSAELILEHRKKFGDFYTVFEVLSVTNLDKDLAQRIIPFIKVEPFKSTGFEEKKYTFWDDFTFYSRVNVRSRYLSDLQPRKGFLDGKYAGSKFRNYNRIIYRYGRNFQAAFLTEKDPGESSFTDHTAFHLTYTNFSYFERIIVGDFLLEFGQGLALWSPYAFGKGAEATSSVVRRNRGIIPYSGADENQFFRGAAFNAKYESVSASLFYSNNNFDANVDTINNIITSLPLDGFHRTENELRRKNAGNLTTLGGMLQYNYNNLLQVGFLSYVAKFDRDLTSSSFYGLRGKEFSYHSLSYNFNYKNITLSGESAFDETSVANIISSQFYVNRDLIFITSLRSYPRNYRTLHGLGFGESSGTQNEIGIYTGVRYRTQIGVINFYYDQFKFPHRTFSINLPTEGNEFLFDLNSRLNRNITSILRLKYERKEVSISTDERRLIAERLRRSIRGEISYNVSKEIRMRTRVELNFFNIEMRDQREKGYLTFQDIRYAPNKNLTVYGRIIAFKTDSFSSAVYEFENDVTGVFANLPMFGEGLRWYFTMRYKVLNNLTLSMKYSETYKPNESTISSGDSQIYRNLDNRLTLQLDASF